MTAKLHIKYNTISHFDLHPGCLYNTGTARCLLRLPTANGPWYSWLSPCSSWVVLSPSQWVQLETPEDKVKRTVVCQSTAQKNKKGKTGLGCVPLLLPLPGVLQSATPRNGTRALSITDAPFNY